MSRTKWFELPIEEAHKLVAPHSLEDVLQELKRYGLITHFEIKTESVSIRTDSQHKFELVLFTEQAKDFTPIFTNQRKRH